MSSTAENQIKIGTHSGTFHCDEALACFMLQQLPEFRNSQIIRTRDQEIINSCDIVVDVGSVYDPPKKRFDHHQKEFTHTLSTLRPNFVDKNIRLSSAGLIYVHYGEEVIQEILKQENITIKDLNVIYKQVYDKFIEEIDGIDNGVPMFDAEPKYKIHTHLSARVQKLNPNWNSPPNVDMDVLFKKAMDLVGSEFVSAVLSISTVWWPARSIVSNAIESRFEAHESGQILVLESFCPWNEHLNILEAAEGLKDEIKFILFPDNNNWRVRAIPIQPGSFVCRIFLNSKWRGKSEEELKEISDIPGMIFCHVTGFIGGNRTKEGALRMALESINP